MTPGEAAVMKTSSDSTPAVAAWSRWMSRCTASWSFQAIGPVQAGQGMVAEEDTPP